MAKEKNEQLPQNQWFEALETSQLRTKTESLHAIENRIELSYPNFRVRSPSTGLPDLGAIEIDYSADRQVIDQSSLDAYISSFRRATAYGEDVVNRIFTDLTALCSPLRMTVRGRFVSDGDLRLSVEVSTE